MEPLKLAGPKLKLADAMGVIQVQESSNPERFKDISLAWQHSRMHSRANQIWESPGTYKIDGITFFSTHL